MADLWTRRRLLGTGLAGAAAVSLGACNISRGATVDQSLDENAGWGGGIAAPIARRVFDYVLMGQYPSEEDMEAVRKGTASAPIGTPRRVQDMLIALPQGSAPQEPLKK